MIEVVTREVTRDFQPSIEQESEQRADTCKKIYILFAVIIVVLFVSVLLVYYLSLKL